VTRGLIENEIVKIVDPQHRDLGQIFEEEVAKKLGVDFWIGRLPEDVFNKRFHPMRLGGKIHEFVEHILPYMLGRADPRMTKMLDSLNNKTSFPGKAFGLVRASMPLGSPATGHCTLPELQVVSPSTNGVSNAKSMAVILMMLANKGIFEGTRILSEQTVTLMLENPIKQLDAALGFETNFTAGGWNVFEVAGMKWTGWAGWGGSLCLFNPDTKSVFAYTMNGMGFGIVGGPRTGAILTAMSKL